MNEHQPVKGQTESNQFAQIIQKFVPYWPLFVISVALCLAIAYIKLRAETPMYIAFAKIMMKDPKGSDTKVLDELNIMGENKSVENEILVLRSAGLMQEVVRRLHLSVSIYNEGRVRVEELYKENSPVAFLPLRRDSINPGGTHYFQMDWEKGEVAIDGQRIPFNGILTIANTKYKVVPNPNYNKSVVGKNYFATFYSVEEAAGGLAASLNATPISMTSSVVDVQITTPVPDKGKDILTELFKVYNDYAIKEKNQAAAKTLEFIEERLADVELQVDSIETNIAQFRTEAAPIDAASQAQTYFSQANSFDQQRNQIDLQLSVLTNVRDAILRGSTVPSLAAVSDPSLSSLVGQLQSAQLRLQQLEATDGPKSDAVVQAKQQVSNLRSNILENIASLQRALNTQKGSYSNLVGRNTSLLKRSPKVEKALQTISRQQGVKNTIYTYLLEKREETALNSASTIADLRELEKASAFGPVSPVPKSFYSKWLMIGLIVPAAFVFIKDQLNRRVQLRQEIESKTDVPIVAEISQVKSDSPIVIREGKRTAVAEQFRSLRTNLTFMGLSEQTNTILVTSSVSGEGKSFAAINLAISFTLIGKKVALMELDLRKPKISRLLQLNSDVGISNYLVNQATISEIIKPTDFKDLYVLSSGIIPPNPAELLQREKFGQLMKEIRERFDYVIIDTAPVGPVTDTFLLKDYADATIYMVRQNKTQRMHLKMIEDIHQKRRFKNLCVVFNGVKKGGFSYGAYGYGNYGSNGEGYYVMEENGGRVRLFGNRIRKVFGMRS